MSEKWTKGPWRVSADENDTGFWGIWGGRSTYLCRLGAGRLPLPLEPSKEESQANARLVAAAPEMAEILRELAAEAAHYIEPGPNGDFLRRLVLDAEEVLAKARGES